MIVFRDGHTLIVHRVLLRFATPRGGWIFQKGDRDRFGSWIAAERVVGIVIGAQRPDGEEVVLTVRSARIVARRQVLRSLFWHGRARVSRPLKVVKAWIKKCACRSAPR